MASYDEYGPETPRGWSPGAVSLVATLVLLLGLGGAITGIYFGNKSNGGPGGQVQQGLPTRDAGGTRTTTPPATTPPPPTTPPVTAPGGRFALPDETGRDFQAARADLRALKLGVVLIFEEGTGDHTVRVTDPAPGASVTKGITIKLYVRGSAPEATVPAVVGVACAQAADLIVEAGLFPSYPNGKLGDVFKQDPEPHVTVPRHWNDTVKIYCGLASSAPPA